MPSSERPGPTAPWNLRTGEATNLGTPRPGEAANASGWIVAIAGSVLRDGAAVELAVPTGQISRGAGVSDTGPSWGTRSPTAMTARTSGRAC